TVCSPSRTLKLEWNRATRSSLWDLAKSCWRLPLCHDIHPERNSGTRRKNAEGDGHSAETPRTDPLPIDGGAGIADRDGYGVASSALDDNAADHLHGGVVYLHFRLGGYRSLSPYHCHCFHPVGRMGDPVPYAVWRPGTD